MRSGNNAAAILDALGDPTRRVIYERLRRAPADGTALARHLPVSRSAVARHLGVLRRAGLVDSHREGPRQIYHVCATGLAPLAQWIA